MIDTSAGGSVAAVTLPDATRFGAPTTPGPLLGAHQGLLNLPGTWTGQGFNLIWRPHQGASDHFLQLNLTAESITFDAIGGTVPNRGLGEPDIGITAVRYLQQIRDANFPVPQGGGGLHVEPGFWLDVPPTKESSTPSVVRCASIPHGTTVMAQGAASKQLPPVISPVSTIPVAAGTTNKVPFPESDLSNQANTFRTSPRPSNLTQELVDNPNSLLTAALATAAAQGFTVKDAVALRVSAHPPANQIGNIPFLGPNAEVASVAATFWVELLEHATGVQRMQLQYSQLVMLNFNGLNWPHVTVGTLARAV